MIPSALRMILALLVVLLLMWLLARMMRRPYTARRAGSLAVLHRQPLSRGAAVAVIRVADRALVVGITEQRVSLLGETDIHAFEAEPGEEHQDVLKVAPDELPGRHPAGHHGRLEGSVLSRRTWGSAIEFLRDRTTRR
ncbi:flagellar biosynthetic protein FliO [Actinoplanes hulinensis]|nr:flagellar biosynthetic protein FliO [Actinoplanes hulinensis]